MQVGAVYVTLRRTFKSAENVQQGTLAGPRFANDGKHLSLHHIERQVLKQDQV
jgi:hypothetical protein